MGQLVGRHGSRGYTRFIILSGPRTGSTLLATSLDSNPGVIGFREVFNFLADDYVPFDVDGYDNFNPRDISWRSEDPVGFLEERIFGRHPATVRAVGFKYQYEHCWGFPGLLEWLVQDDSIHVLHLKRQNLLRVLVSAKMAEATGVFWEDTRQGLTLARIVRAARHPLRATYRWRRRIRGPKHSPGSPRPQVRISPTELIDLANKTNQQVTHYDGLFREHPMLDVLYEDMVDHQEKIFHQVQSFLSLEPRPLAVTLRKQNPEPLRELIENYDELYEAKRDSPYADMFE